MSTNNPNGLTGGLPPLPSSPIAPNAGAKKNTPAPSEVADQPAPADAPVAIPELANLPTPPDPNAVATTPTTEPANPAAETADAAPAIPAINESGDQVAGEGAAQPLTGGGGLLSDVASPPTSLPGLGSFPVAPLPGNSSQPSSPNSFQNPTMLSGVDVEAPPAAPKTRTWKTRLAPAVIPHKTSFNYRRQVLPDAIYRKQYDRENRHLPLQVTREDYAQLLIQRVAANDINGTRALLNEGLSVNTTDAYGQSLLTVARRVGAHDTERLLIARGAS